MLRGEGYSWLYIPISAQGIIQDAGIKPESAVCKASNSPDLLSFWPPVMPLFLALFLCRLKWASSFNYSPSSLCLFPSRWCLPLAPHIKVKGKILLLPAVSFPTIQIDGLRILMLWLHVCLVVCACYLCAYEWVAVGAVCMCFVWLWVCICMDLTCMFECVVMCNCMFMNCICMLECIVMCKCVWFCGDYVCMQLCALVWFCVNVWDVCGSVGDVHIIVCGFCVCNCVWVRH